MSCVGKIDKYSSNLRHIDLYGLRKLKELWRMKGEGSSDILVRCFQAVERLHIRGCESFVNTFTPTVTNSNMRISLMNVSIDGMRPLKESERNIEPGRKSQEINVISKPEISEVYGEFSIHPTPNHLESLKVWGCKAVEVVFEIESSSGSRSKRELTTTQRSHQPLLLLPYLKDLHLMNMDRMSDVWKCNWKKLVIPQNQSQSSFHNLTNITMRHCNSIKYLFSPLMGKLLLNLKKVWIDECDGIEEVVSNRDDDENEATSISTHTNTIISFPRLERLFLWELPCLKSIDGDNVRGRSTTFTTTSIHDHQFKCFQGSVDSWFLSQHPKYISICSCDVLSRVFPSNVVGRLHKLEELHISRCKSMVEIFEIEGVNNERVHDINTVGEGSNDACTAITIPRSANMTFLELPNLTKLHIGNCEVLEYIFVSSTLESLKQLKELIVEGCKAMHVIVKEDVETSQTIVFPRLKSLTLGDLPNVKGFFLGMNEFQWPLLEKVKMYGCPQMMIFTSGHSMAPKLNGMHTGLGKHSLECGLNFCLKSVTHETQLDMCCAPDMIKLLQFPWSFSNLVEVDAQGYNDKLLKSRIIFPCNELLHLKNLEKLYLTDEYGLYISTVEEVFEVEEGTNDDVNVKTQSVVVFPKLKEVAPNRISTLQHMWKINQRMVLNFPNLTKVLIKECRLLGHVFTCCMVGSLLQLQELQISNCKNMDAIVKHVEDSEIEVVFPCLKSITLHKLPNFKGFCLGKIDFVWPSLDTLEIKDCPEITVFTIGQSTTPKLKLIDTTFGLFHAMEDPNSFIKSKQQEGWQF